MRLDVYKISNEDFDDLFEAFDAFIEIPEGIYNKDSDLATFMDDKINNNNKFYKLPKPLKAAINEIKDNQLNG